MSLLKANGWTVNPGGTSTCTSPGTGTGQCGAGVPAGAKASFKLEYESGQAALDEEMAQFKSDFAQAGIAIDLTDRALRHRHRERRSLQVRLTVHLGHGVLGRWLDLRT